MNKEITARYNSHKKTKEYFDEESGLYVPIPTFPPIYAIYTGHYYGLEAAMELQGYNIGPTTTTKGVVKELMVSTILMYADRGCVQAVVVNLPEIAKSLDITSTYLYGKGDEDAKINCTNIKNILKDNIGVLDQVTAADVVTMEKIITKFSDYQVLPAKKISIRKSDGTDQIKILMDALDDDRKMLTKIVSGYTQEKLDGYFEMIKIGKPEGVRKLSLRMNFSDLDTHVPVSRVKVTLTNGEQTIVKYSTRFGAVSFYSVPIGSWKATAEHKLYQKYETEKMGIDDKHVERVAVVLRGVIISSI